MKKNLSVFIAAVLIVISLGSLLNRQTSIQQCVDYRCRAITMPLYLKLLDFFDRHYNYRHLVKSITKGANTEEEKIMKLFIWTHHNIRRLPKDLPVMDDHVWYTIVRGYGVNDQFSDVFTTLCNYSGIEAFFFTVSTIDKKESFPFAFVKVDKKWVIFDPYHGIYFINNSGGFVDLGDLKSNNWRLRGLEKEAQGSLDYPALFANLGDIGNIGLTRSNIQSPLNRLRFEIKRRLGSIPNNKE